MWKLWLLSSWISCETVVAPWYWKEIDLSPILHSFVSIVLLIIGQTILYTIGKHIIALCWHIPAVKYDDMTLVKVLSGSIQLINIFSYMNVTLSNLIGKRWHLPTIYGLTYLHWRLAIFILMHDANLNMLQQLNLLLARQPLNASKRRENPNSYNS